MEASGKVFWRERTDSTRKAAAFLSPSCLTDRIARVPAAILWPWSYGENGIHLLNTNTEEAWFPDDFIPGLACPPLDRHLLQERVNLKVKSLLLSIFYQLPNMVPNWQVTLSKMVKTCTQLQFMSMHISQIGVYKTLYKLNLRTSENATHHKWKMLFQSLSLCSTVTIYYFPFYSFSPDFSEHFHTQSALCKVSFTGLHSKGIHKYFPSPLWLSKACQI